MTRRCACLAGAMVLGLLCTSTASARLGETLEQLTARFGKPSNGVVMFDAIQPAGAKRYLFHKENVNVVARFRGKVCEYINYSSSAKPFSDEQIEELLKANGGPWVEEKKPTWEVVKNRRAEHMWRRQDNQAWAEQNQRSLSIMTFEWIEAVTAAEEQVKQKAGERKKLKGF